MVLSDYEIRDLVLNYAKYNLTKPLISDFEEKNLQAASYDVSITDDIIIFNTNIDNQVIDIKQKEELLKSTKSLKIKEDGYIIKPNEYILAKLKETITMPKDLIANIRPRTSFTRLGLIVVNQHFNPCYSGKSPIGIFNASPNPIKIYSNLRVAQIVFEKINTIPSMDKWYSNNKNSKYQGEEGDVSSKIYEELTPEAKEKIDTIVNHIVDKVIGN